MKNSERQAVMLNGYQSFSFGSSICSPVLSAKLRIGFKALRRNPVLSAGFKAPRITSGLCC